MALQSGRRVAAASSKRVAAHVRAFQSRADVPKTFGTIALPPGTRRNVPYGMGSMSVPTFRAMVRFQRFHSSNFFRYPALLTALLDQQRWGCRASMYKGWGVAVYLVRGVLLWPACFGWPTPALDAYGHLRYSNTSGVVTLLYR